MIWRENKDPQIPTQDAPADTGYTTPVPYTSKQLPAPVRSIERNLEICDFPQPPQIPTREEVMQELVDVTIQYTNCADPVESEARRQRVLQSNAEGIMEETTDRIIAAATMSHLEASQQLAEIPPRAPILLPGPGMFLDLGDQPKRRGRPPKEKRQSPKPRALPGSSSHKRNIVAGHPSPARTLRIARRQNQQPQDAAALQAKM